MKQSFAFLTLLVISSFTYGKESLIITDRDIENVIAAYEKLQLPPDPYGNWVEPGDSYHVPSKEEVMELVLRELDYQKIHQDFLKRYHADTTNGRLMRAQLDYKGFDDIEQFSMASALMFAVSYQMTALQYNFGGSFWNALLDRAEEQHRAIPGPTKAVISRNLRRIHDFIEAQEAKSRRPGAREH